MTSLAITGVTGAIGGLVARQLSDQGIAARLLARDPSRAPDLPHMQTFQAEYGGDACRSALEGIDTALLVSAHESADRVDVHRAFVRAAVEAGVRQIVYTSFVGAGDDAGFLLAQDHGATEAIIRDAGVEYTFLRDNFYAEVFPHFADDQGAIKGPAGKGRCAAVSRRDVAAVAATVLPEPRRHSGQVYDLTGPEALDLDEIARILSDVTGRPHRYVDETMEQARASRAAYNAPDWLVDAWISTYTAIRDGELDDISDDVPRLLGRPATTFAQAVADPI